MDAWLESFARANFRRSADTAHDLKTPLNVAVLNLELLRMRLRKVAPADDEKIEGYTSAIELELRRMGRIFDAFFLLSTPPKNDETPAEVDLTAITKEFQPRVEGEPAVITAHASRIRQAVKLFFEGAAKVFETTDSPVAIHRGADTFTVEVSGKPASAEFDSNKIFKFYYTDPHGQPDLSLAVARLIAETYGGELDSVADERDTVSLRLSFPLGAR